MGVWHLSGMGVSPGAVTVPLTYLYLLLASATKGDERAKRFFATSGERGQELVGAPECIVIFTSREVITGKSGDKPFEGWERARESIKSDWFSNFQAKGTASETVARYLSVLFENLKDAGFRAPYDGEWIKGIFFVEVNHQDFNDCFLKVGVTFKALSNKEVWVNMIGGTNQINISLLLAGSLFAVPARYYYIFQSDQSLLNPEIEKPEFRKLRSFSGNLSRWHELPVFQLDIGPILRRLDEEFRNRPAINQSQLEKILEDEGLSKQYIAKLRGRIVSTDGERIIKGPLFDELVSMKNRIEEKSKGIDNVSSWIKWASSEHILWRVFLDGKLEKVPHHSL